MAVDLGSFLTLAATVHKVGSADFAAVQESPINDGFLEKCNKVLVFMIQSFRMATRPRLVRDGGPDGNA